MLEQEDKIVEEYKKQIIQMINNIEDINILEYLIEYIKLIIETEE